jgi:hypothetical protein
MANSRQGSTFLGRGTAKAPGGPPSPTNGDVDVDVVVDVDVDVDVVVDSDGDDGVDAIASRRAQQSLVGHI